MLLTNKMNKYQYFKIYNRRQTMDKAKSTTYLGIEFREDGNKNIVFV